MCIKWILMLIYFDNFHGFTQSKISSFSNGFERFWPVVIHTAHHKDDDYGRLRKDEDEMFLALYRHKVIVKITNKSI
jgi:hypothetical protein